MKKEIFNIVKAAIVIFGITSFSAYGETLDFTQSPYVGNNGNFAGTTYSITSVGGPLSWGSAQDGSTCFGLSCQRDGLGVGDDEITIGGEQIRIDFGQAIRISGLAFLDLFTSTNGQSRERAIVQYDGGSMFFDSLISENPNGDSGFLMATGLNILTDYLIFSAGGTNDNLGRDDYALAAIVSPVPLPPAVLMFGFALGGIGFLSRRRKQPRQF